MVGNRTWAAEDILDNVDTWVVDGTNTSDNLPYVVVLHTVEELQDNPHEEGNQDGHLLEEVVVADSLVDNIPREDKDTEGGWVLSRDVVVLQLLGEACVRVAPKLVLQPHHLQAWHDSPFPLLHLEVGH